jgi:iron complex outermembrane receptor protein
MRVDEFGATFARFLRCSVISFASICLLSAPQAMAQDDEGASSAADDDEIEEVVVTGSRLKRDTYTSIAPLQIISGQVSREVGLMDVGDILQESTASSGQQIDLTFNGFVLDNGPGATNINLRGLGGARTLVLINGRRLAPAGVEGAPTAPDLGLVPSSLVQQYDLLLDGASSIYGSDAVAGVANIIMRKDFDGLEIEAFHEVPQYSGGVQNTISLAWGKNFDRGFIGMGAEHTEQDRVTLSERPWTDKCDRHAEFDENGNIRSQEEWYPTNYMMPWDDCKGGADLFTLFPMYGATEAVFWTPGSTNIGVPNWSEWAEFFVLDNDGDGVADVNFRDYSRTDKNGPSDLFAKRKTTSAMIYGEYTFEGEANITPFFEVQYGRRESQGVSRTFPLFPAVPALNPFNPCNPDGIRGVDCGLAYNELLTNPGFLEDFVAAGQPYGAVFGETYGDLCAFFGIAPCSPATLGVLGILGPATAIGPVGSPQHIVYIDGDRNNTDVDIDQTRVVAGVRGDIPAISFGSVENWSFELAGIYSKSNGTSQRFGVREDKLDFALGWYSTTNTPCQNNIGVPLPAADTAVGCVPVDIFAPSLLNPFLEGSLAGQFATEAERDAVFGVRFFETEYEQRLASLYLSGDIFELPGGTVAAGFGYETRKDELTSLPNQVAADGLFFGFSVDEGAIGDKTVDEFFAEVELPILAGVTAFEELTVNLSTRYTDDEIYGGNWTGSYKLGWRPIDSLLIRGTYGTSFRAPNLRELFLAGQTGFNNSFFDPCYVPQSAINEATDEYDADLDRRDPVVLANCLANGVDPTLARIGAGITQYPVEIKSGGALDLFAEKSDSWTAGLVWDLPFNAFDLTIGGSYYEIDIRNTIIEPSENFIVGDCYGSATGNSPFCERITRDFTDETDPRITLIDAGFINRDNESARGVDLNLAFADTWTIFERPIDVTLDMRANRQLERSTLFVSADGVSDFNEFKGSFGFPPWKGRSIIRFDYADWRVSWETNYLGSVQLREELQDEFDDISGLSDTCFGPPDDVLCRDVDYAENYFRHAVSVYYYGDEWTLGAGIRNVLAEDPPFVDGSEVQAINNAPIGYGYDLMGRTYFFNASYNFGGGE